MPQRTDFARYLPAPPGPSPWGITVYAGGRLAVPRDASYPPSGHPEDHFFTWEKGRVLAAWQIVFVHRGAGQFESHASGLLPVAQGTAMILFPGEWHRYRPDVHSGWEELWIELQGSTLDALAHAQILNPSTPLVPLPDPLPLLRCLEAIHGRLEAGKGSIDDPVRDAQGLEAVAWLASQARAATAGEAADLAVIREAERILSERYRDPPSIPNLAKSLRIEYGRFRRLFRRYTGLPPNQYVQRLRLDQAQRRIGAGLLTLEAIAEELGYSSAFHLSNAFKARYGASPSVWRKRHS